jgi:hypothetical protein
LLAPRKRGFPEFKERDLDLSGIRTGETNADGSMIPRRGESLSRGPRDSREVRLFAFRHIPETSSEEQIMATGPPRVFPSGTCQGVSNWQFSGGVWSPVGPAVPATAVCAVALQFQNGSRKIVVRPPDLADYPEIQAIMAQSPSSVVTGLSSDDTTALWSNYPDDVGVDTSNQVFTLPLVPRGTIVDITPGPNPTPLPAAIRAILFPNRD